MTMTVFTKCTGVFGHAVFFSGKVIGIVLGSIAAKAVEICWGYFSKREDQSTRDIEEIREQMRLQTEQSQDRTTYNMPTYNIQNLHVTSCPHVMMI